MSNPARNILFIGKRFYTNKDAWAERFGRIYRLPAGWASLGERVQLWLLDYHTRDVVEATEAGLNVVSGPIVGTTTLRAVFGALRTRPCIVVASGDCYIGLLGWLVARATRSKFVFDIYDKYDEFAGYHRPLGFNLFGFLRRRADRRLYSSRALADAYRSDDQVDAVVPNGVDELAFRPLSLGACRAQLGLESSCRLVGYFGGMEPDRGVGDLIQAVGLLRSSGHEVQLLICGKQHPSTPLDRDGIIYRGMVPHDQMPAYINASDVVVIPYRNSAFMDMGASCKIAEYLMCGRPIVSTTTPNFAANFPAQAAELGAGMCSAGNPMDLARAIEHQLQVGQILASPTDFAWPAIAARALRAIDAAESQPAINI